MILEKFDVFKQAKHHNLEQDSGNNGWINIRDFVLEKDMIENGKLKFKFSKSMGSFYAKDLLTLSTLENFPLYVRNELILDYLEIDTLETLPTTKIDMSLHLHFLNLKNIKNNLIDCNYIKISNCTLTSLEGLENINCKSLRITDTNLTTLKGMPYTTEKLSCKDIDVTNLEFLTNSVKIITFHECDKLTSLYGIPKNIEKANFINCENIPLLEKDFVANITLNGYINYYTDLLQFAYKAGREKEISELHLPDNIKDKLPNLNKSIKGISKFNI